MAITRLEALVNAIAALNGYHDPKSEAYQLRNPLLLKAFSPKHERNERGIRNFMSIASGFDNCVGDARIKCSGKSHSKVTPFSTLQDLIQVYGQPITAGRAVKNHLRAALGEEVSERIQLRWFIDDSISALDAIQPLVPSETTKLAA